MAKKEINMEEYFDTLPELPNEFENWCYSFLPKIPIYYRRIGNQAECQCGKCGMHYVENKRPSRNEPATCPYCGNNGFYEWKKVTNGKYCEHALYLLQRTSDGNLVSRYFVVEQLYRQGIKAKIDLIERKRIFLSLGDVLWFNYEYHWCGRKGWQDVWERGKGHCPMHDGEIYAGWLEEIKESNLKYCDVIQIRKMTYRPRLNILIAYANNPAIEMFSKSGMDKLVDFLIGKQGKTKWVNRRGKNLKQQLRLKDKQKINKFIESKGNVELLEILQMEEKKKVNYTLEQEQFLLRTLNGFYGERKKVNYLLKYMTLQQLMNRIKKYQNQFGYHAEYEVIGRYYDYLQMRMELGYDMTNEVYLYPKNLKEKHDEMVAERKARQDELYITKKMQQYPAIATRYKKLCKKYYYESEGYVIRPAKTAEEIIVEGRMLHHCVGGDGYLHKHNEGKTTILFLRKTENPDEPYYTIEIKKNKIIQWYGLRDKKPDKEIIEPWLNEYVRHLEEPKQRIEMVAG